MPDFSFRSAPGSVIETRKRPIAHLNITATTSGTAQDLFTVREGVALLVRQLAVVNTSGSAATLTLHTVPDAGTIATGNAELVGYSIAANTAVDLTALIQGLYEQGTTAKVWAGTTAVLNVHGWGEEIL